ncbi:MAG: hypothetical protein U1F08_13285 [Steroidobacteraceae bacterium]
MNRRRQRGVVLAIVVMLLAIVAVLCSAGLATAALDLRLAGNEADWQRAFDAAEVAIAEALRSADLSPAWTYARPKVAGTARCTSADCDAWSYRLWYDGEADPPDPSDREAGLRAHHFVVESEGRAGRGASVTLVQGFYVLTPDPPPPLLSPPCPEPCLAAGPFGPRRTYWRQVGAE